MKSHPVLRLILKTFFVVLVLYIAARFVVLSGKVSAEKERNEELTKQVADQYQRNSELEDVAENGVTEAYILRRAHEKGYVLQNESIYRDIYAAE